MDAVLQFDFAAMRQGLGQGGADIDHVVLVNIDQEVFTCQPGSAGFDINAVQTGYGFVVEIDVAVEVVTPDADAADGAERQPRKVLLVAQGAGLGAFLGDVARRAIQQPAFGHGVPRKGAVCAVLGAQTVFEVERPAALPQQFEAFADTFYIVGVGNPFRRASGQFVLTPAEDLRPGRTDALPHTVLAADHERVL